MELYLEHLREVVLTLRFGDAGYPYIMDSKGNLIIHPQLEGENVFESTDQQGRKIIQDICAMKTGRLIYNWRNPGESERREKMAVFQYIPEYDWIVASSSYLEDYYRPLRTIKYSVIASLAGTALLAFLLSLWLSSSLTRPLKNLMASLARGGQGDFSARCQISSHDEMGMLGGYFNDFMAQLETYSAQLKSSEEKYRGIFENSIMGLFQTTADGRLLSLNQALADIWGFKSPEEVLELVADVGRQSYLDPKDREAFQKIMRQRGQVTGFETRMRRRDGREIWVSISGRVVTNDQGEIDCYEGSLVDITAQKEAQADYHRSMDRYRLLLEATPDAVTVYDQVGRVVYVNQAFTATFGWSLEEIEGKRLDFVPEGEELRTRDAVSRTIKGERVLFETKRLTKDGRVLDVQINSASYYDAEGKMEGALVISRDVTNRKRAEEALRASEERYRTILENIEDGYYELDLAGRFTFFNESIRKAVGYSEDELKRLDFREYVSPEYLQAAMNTFSEVFQTGRAATVFDWEVIKKDGSRGFIEASISLIRDAQGQPTGFRGIGRDITARKRAEAALEREKNRFQVLVEESPLGVSLIQPDGRLEYVNPAFVKIFGYGLADLVWGREWLRKVFPDQQMRHRVVREWLAEQEAIGLGQHSSRTYEVVCRDGSRKSVHFSPVALQSGGHLVIYEDITESERAEEALRTSEERYRTILASIEDGYYEVDLEGSFTFFNGSMCRILGYEPGELHGKNYHSYVVPSNIDKVFATFNRVFRTGQPTKALDWLLLRQDGREVFVEISVSPIRSAEGRVSGFRGIARDVSERKQAEDALRRAHDELEVRVAERTAELAEANQHLQELDKMKSDFLSSVSHELRTPLTSVLGFAKLIKREFHNNFFPLAEGDAKTTRKAGRIEENLDIIVREGERLTRLINDVLDLSKIESGRMDWRDEACVLAELVEQAVQAVSGEFANRTAVKLEMELAGSLPPIVADRDRLVQVMINLLNNASKFTAQGRVAIQAQTTPAGWARVAVSDTGPGIPAENLAQVFDQFYQVTSGDTLSDKPKGTGLGLSICKQIVEHYGGRLWAESTLGQGSTFIFELPPQPGQAA
jgi:PAS domain S-box-containing protein